MEFDQSWVDFEQSYFKERMKIDEDALSAVKYAIDCEKELS